MLQFNSILPDIAIGTICVILLFSIFHSGVMELIQVYMRSRNHFLMQSIDKVFNDHTNLNLSEMLFNHPFIKFTRPHMQTLPAYISSGFFADAIIDILHSKPLVPPTDLQPVETSAPDDKDPVLKAIRTNTGQMKHSEVKVLLQSLLLHAKSLVEFRTVLCRWYDDHMERVSSQYKRRMLKWSMLLGVTIAVAANANLITIVKAISQDSELRNTLVVQAETLNREYEANKAQGGNPDPGAEVIRAKLDTTAQTIRALGLPIGWNCGDGTADEVTSWRMRNFRTESWPLVILGWVLMGAAMSFGSDYWFNILSKFFQLRGVLKPAKAEEKK